MSPEEINAGVAFSAQIIGLLSVWKAERKSVTDDAFQDFSVWLANHNFNAISDRIFASEEVQRELHVLLSQSIEKIDGKIDRLENLMTNVSSKLDGLSQIDRAVFADDDTLSTQAREILKLFADSGANKMIVAEIGPHRFIHLDPTGQQYTMEDEQFLFEDVEALESEGLIRLHEHNGSGHGIYHLTRPGKEMATVLPSVVLKAGIS